MCVEKKGKGKKKNAEAAKKAAEEKDLLLESFKQMNLTGSNSLSPLLTFPFDSFAQHNCVGVGRCLLKGCNCKYFIGNTQS